MTPFEIALLVMLGAIAVSAFGLLVLMLVSRANEADFNERLAALDDELSALAERRAGENAAP